jgi:hypothetical protein
MLAPPKEGFGPKFSVLGSVGEFVTRLVEDVDES